MRTAFALSSSSTRGGASAGCDAPSTAISRSLSIIVDETVCMALAPRAARLGLALTLVDPL